MIRQCLLNVRDNLLRLDYGEIVIDQDLDIGVNPVSQPACLHVLDAAHSIDMGGRVLDFVEDIRLDTIEHAAKNLAARVLQDEEDRNGDEQPDDRIDDRVTGPCANNRNQYRERCEAIDFGMLAIGDERGGADLLAGPNLQESDGLVAKEADDCRRGDPSQIVHGLRIDEFANRFVASYK